MKRFQLPKIGFDRSILLAVLTLLGTEPAISSISPTQESSATPVVTEMLSDELSDTWGVKQNRVLVNSPLLLEKQAAPPFPYDPGPDYLRPEFINPNSPSQTLSFSHIDLTGAWTITVGLFSVPNCSVIPNSTQTYGMRLYSGPPYRISGPGANGGVTRVDIYEGAAFSNSQFSGRGQVLTWSGTLSSNGNTIQGQVSCGNTASIPFTMTRVQTQVGEQDRPAPPRRGSW